MKISSYSYQPVVAVEILTSTAGAVVVAVGVAGVEVGHPLMVAAAFAEDDVAVVVWSAFVERDWSEPNPAPGRTGSSHHQCLSHPDLHPGPQYQQPDPTS